MDSARACALVRTVAGGRFPLLRMCGSSPRPVQAIADELDVQMRLNLRRAGVRSDAPLFRALLAARGRLPADRAEQLLPAAQLERLLALNILSAHPDRTYTFHDRHAALFMERANRGAGRAWWRQTRSQPQ